MFVSIPVVMLKKLFRPLDAAIAQLSQRGMNEDFVRFAIVGSLGLCWDTGTVYALRGMVGLYIAGAISYLVASTANWALNRVWTFRERQHSSIHIQWMRFFIANLLGFLVNRGLYFTLISFFILCRSEPVLPIFAGSVVGLCFNYSLSKRFVFS